MNNLISAEIVPKTLSNQDYSWAKNNDFFFKETPHHHQTETISFKGVYFFQRQTFSVFSLSSFLIIKKPFWKKESSKFPLKKKPKKPHPGGIFSTICNQKLKQDLKKLNQSAALVLVLNLETSKDQSLWKMCVKNSVNLAFHFSPLKSEF